VDVLLSGNNVKVLDVATRPVPTEVVNLVTGRHRDAGQSEGHTMRLDKTNTVPKDAVASALDVAQPN